MSILMEVFKEEYDRLDRQEASYKRAILDLPKGYISKKNIRGKEAYYLQHREGKKIVSKYIPVSDVESIREQIQRRKQFEQSLKRVAEDKKQLRKVLDI